MVAVVTVLILRRTCADRPPTRAGRRFRWPGWSGSPPTDHVAALLWMGTADVLTLMVLQELGPEASAYYFMANTIAYGLFLVTSNISSALVAEGARSPERVVGAGPRRRCGTRPCWSSRRRRSACCWPRPVLGLFGRDYAANGTVLLQLLLLSAVPQIVIGVALAAARLRQDLRTIAAHLHRAGGHHLRRVLAGGESRRPDRRRAWPAWSASSRSPSSCC